MAGIRLATSSNAISGGERSELGSKARVKTQTVNAMVTTKTAATPQVA